MTLRGTWAARASFLAYTGLTFVLGGCHRYPDLPVAALASKPLRPARWARRGHLAAFGVSLYHGCTTGAERSTWLFLVDDQDDYLPIVMAASPAEYDQVSRAAVAAPTGPRPVDPSWHIVEPAEAGKLGAAIGDRIEVDATSVVVSYQGTIGLAPVYGLYVRPTA